MKVLLTGAAGQLGQELRPRLETIGDVIAIDLAAPGAGDRHTQFDLSNEGQLEVLLNRNLPDLIVNAAAYTAVDQAENEPDLAFTVNASVPGRMARWAARNQAALVHYSTDYVFDGQQERPYRESDRTGPLNVYGDSKFAGEQAIESSGCRHVTLRSSWIYSSHGNNFVLKMLELARQRPALQIVGDQSGCPTWARNLADYSILAINKCLLGRRKPKQGILHATDRDPVSWFDFACKVFDTAVELGILDRRPEVERVTSEQFPQLAVRPRCSVLDSRALEKTLGIRTAGLDDSLKKCMQELVNHE